MKISKKGILAFAMAMLMLATCACSQAMAETYTAEAQGFGGVVTAVVTVNADAIESVEVTGDNETQGIGSRAIAELPAIILEAQSIDVDVISGATFSSNAVLKAVADALAQAGREVEIAAVPQSYKAGAYTAASKGHNGPVEVSVEFSDSAIISVEVVSSSDTPSLVNTAAAKICPAIVENQSLAVDTVTTASFSSRGILRAVADCVTQAGGDVEALKKAPLKPVTPEADAEMTADIVIIGGGTSGSLAVLSAARAGLKAICIESAPVVGGAGEIAGFANMQWFGSSLQQNNPELEPLDLPEFIQTKIATYNEMVNYRADSRIYKHYFEDVGPMVDMLEDIGMELTPSSNTGIKISPKGTRFGIMHEKAAELGAQTLLETRGEQLLIDENGAIAGVIATRADGSKLTIHTTCAILCTGGASANQQMMLDYFPDYTEYAENCGISSTDGKGLEMAWEIGAAKGSFGVHAHNHTMPLSAKYAGIDTVTATDDIAITANVPLLWLDRYGMRFGNEELCYKPTPGGNIVFMAKRAFVVMDQATVDAFAETGTPIKPWRGKKDEPMPMLQQQLDEGVINGYVFKGDTIEELALATGWEPSVAQEQIERYNGNVAAKVDSDYGKSADSLLYTIESAPFYAIEIRPRVLGSFGGLNVTGDYKVLNNAGRPIPGLYAAGDMAAGWFGPVYPNIGGLTSGFNTTSGYSSVQCALEYLGK